MKLEKVYTDIELLKMYAPLLDAVDFKDIGERLQAAKLLHNAVNVIDSYPIPRSEEDEKRIKEVGVLIPIFARFIKVFGKSSSFEQAESLYNFLKDRGFKA